MAQTFPREPGAAYGELLTNQRQAEAAYRALEAVRRAWLKRWTWGSPPTPCSPTWREALSALGSLTGQSVREDVTARIFQRFCVGK